MSEAKGQKPETLWEKVKGYSSNITYIVLAIAVFIMICIAAGHYQMPRWKPKYDPINQLPGILYGCPNLSEKRNNGGVLLSFLGGPTEGTTKSIVDRLDHNNLTALFFMTSQEAVDNPDLVKLAAISNQIGVYLKDDADVENFQENLKAAERAIFNITKEVPRFLKIVNDSVTQDRLEKARHLGYTVVVAKPLGVNEQRPEQDDEQDVKVLFQHLTGGSILCLPDNQRGLELLKSFTVDKEDSGESREKKINELQLLSVKECFNV